MAANTRLRMLEAAERLFGERGIAGVSLREIGVSAGQRNTSAALYHFGSKRGLVEALLAHRMEQPNARTLQLLAALDREGRTGDLRALVEVMIVPFAETFYAHPHYARFLSQLFADPQFQKLGPRSLRNQYGVRRLNALVDRALAHLPPAVRLRRQTLAASVFVHAAADAVPDFHQVPMRVYAEELVDAISGLLAAPSTASRAARKRAKAGAALRGAGRRR
jgi:AcrR family transcriptional regulator